ncbi:MAG: hypothetical protein V2A79_08085 [Planctomycetota bacterium]
MNPADNIERSIKELRFSTTAALDERILAHARAALEPSKSIALDPTRSSAWRIIVRSRWTKLVTAAAVIAIGVTLSLTAVHESATPAYAIEQTLEANRQLRYVHIRVEPAGSGLAEAWVELGEQGDLLRLRMDFPSTEDGPKVVIWQGLKAEVWFKAKDRAVTMHAADQVARFPKMLEMFDPKRVADALYQAQADGRVSLETKLPSTHGEPIVLVATSLPTPEQQDVYQVDPVTKLVQRVEKYRLEDEQYRFESRWDYLDYNQTPDPNAFVLSLPPDIIRIDETTQVIGLAKGDLSDAEITVQVAREFFEALIAKDYAKAGQLAGGMPAAKMEEAYGDASFVRIVSIGEPIPQPIPGVGGMVVVCRVEVESDGLRHVAERRLAIRPVYSQPDRWEIHGGV